MTTWNSHNLAINVHRSKFLLVTNVPTTQIGRHEFAWKDLTDKKPAITAILLIQICCILLRENELRLSILG